MSTPTKAAPPAKQNVNVSSKMPEGYLKLRHNLWKDPNLKGTHVKLCLHYMLSKPPAWKFNTTDIANAVDCCVDTVEKSITKLRMAGYCLRYQVKDRSRFAGWVMQVSDVPTWFNNDDNVLLRQQAKVVYRIPPYLVSPETEGPVTDGPATVSPCAAVTRHSKNDCSEKDSSETEVAAAPSVSSSRLRPGAAKPRQAEGLSNNDGSDAPASGPSHEHHHDNASPSAQERPASPAGLFDELNTLVESPAPEALPVDVSAYPSYVQRFVAQWDEAYRLAKRVPFRWTPKELDRVEHLLEHEGRTKSPVEVILLLVDVWTRKLEGTGGMEPYWACVNYGTSPSKLLHVPRDKTEPMIERIKSELGWTYSAMELDRARAIFIRLRNEQKPRLDVAAKS